MQGSKVSVLYDMHKYSVILLERVYVKVMIAIALIHLCLGVDSPLSYVKNKILLFLATSALSSKMIQVSLPTTWKDFPNIFINIWF